MYKNNASQHIIKRAQEWLRKTASAVFSRNKNSPFGA